MRRLRFVLFGFIAFTAIADAQSQSPNRRHWQLSESEALWTGRYSNCQYGYYSLLADGVTAHAERPPNPHHGFLVNLPDVDSKQGVSVYDSARFVWVNAEYNTTEESTLAGISAYEIDIARRHKENFNLVERQLFKLRSVPAIRFKVEYDSPKGRIVEEEVVTFHSGIVYEIGLRSPTEDYAADLPRLDQILAGFRFRPVPKGQCWNE